ncbi:adenosylcobinamide kinase /adenosylcobinamide-phosphate guanylyltransferase [Mesobacillus persicus]|uniref:Adenosylcobinamide kinase n=1 Tax=Mesobacillus persicus TaxID=930146 RepID=A0A1H7VMC9_9BACI|nr:bifunctional adenosylcobinamide kinase/adenosylcobinamide-phosphate guanylyltransferase [Mesobacillus persicus]SEM09938.1 adenosylcobinamide kinase /adenosylcobinamide-phosphate guanylyltransferase [Mesobacillus persicus]
MAEQSFLIFISGGVRSGKSQFAEKLAVDLSGLTPDRTGNTPYQLHYIAAGQASDEEMKTRILRHQTDRHFSGLNWITWEQPTELTKLSEVFSKHDVVLLDCLTTLLNNEFFKEENLWGNILFQEQIMAEILEAIEKITSSCHALIVVSNEVFYDTSGDQELIYTYKKILGKLHQKVVAKAQKAYLVESGIPLLMKGGKSI